MEAKAIVFTEPRKPVLQTIPLPETLEPREVRCRTLYSGVSIGTERLLWENRLPYAKFPQVIGYQATGIVEEVGDEITDVKVGDQVVYRQSRFAGEEVFPVSGCHASAAVVERHQLTPAPDADPQQASLYVLPAVGFHGVMMAEVAYTDLVAVQGLGLVGLAVVAASRLRGARIVAIDVSDQRLEAAKAMGADVLVNPNQQDAIEAVQALDAEGADVVFEATGFGKLIDPALALVKRRGRFVLQGNYGQEPVSYHFLTAHGKQITAVYPCNDGLQPCRRAVLQLMARGALDFNPAITHRVGPADAVGLYENIIAGEGAAGEALGIVINWQDA